MIKQRWVRPIHSLPDNVVSEIIARVAAHSLKDLVSVKLSCKRWNELSDDWCVYKHASLPTFPEWKELGTNPGTEFDREGNTAKFRYKNVKAKKRKISLFVQKCSDAGNPQALYRRGLIDYFEGREREIAIGWLKKAADAGNFAAQYVICIISIFSGSEQDKKNGMVALSGIMKDGRKQVRKARLLLTKILFKRPLTKIPIHALDAIPVCCTIPGHDTSGRNVKYLARATGSDDEDEAECSFCRCDLEIKLIKTILLCVGFVPLPNACAIVD